MRYTVLLAISSLTIRCIRQSSELRYTANTQLEHRKSLFYQSSLILCRPLVHARYTGTGKCHFVFASVELLIFILGHADLSK